MSCLKYQSCKKIECDYASLMTCPQAKDSSDSLDIHSRPSEESRPALPVPEHEQQAEKHLPPGTTIHTRLNGHHHPQGEEPSVQHSSNSNSSIGGDSACSLVNNESLGLDERGIFEHFNKRDRYALKVSFLPAHTRLCPLQAGRYCIAGDVHCSIFPIVRLFGF